MNSGAPITGKDRRPLNKAGMDIRSNPSFNVRLWPEDARHHANKAIGVAQPSCVLRLLAERPGHVIFGLAITRFALAARQVDFRRALFGGIGVEALAFLVALGLTELVGARLAVRRAVGGHQAGRATRYHQR